MLRVRQAWKDAPADDYHVPWNRRRECLPRGFLQVSKLRPGTHARWAESSETVRCAQTKAGKPCRAAPTAGGLCFFHANPSKASEMGRIGGKINRHVAGEKAPPLRNLDTAIAVRDAVDRLIADIYAGKTHPRIATALAPLLNLQMRAIEITETTKTTDL